MKQILFLAALWGIIEATFGWLFHLIHIPAGVILIPLGTFILLSGYSINFKRSDVLIIGLITATIKLSNIFLPGAEFVYRPLISILLQTIFIAYLAPYIKINFSAFRRNFLKAEVPYLVSWIGILLAIITSYISK